MICVFDAGMVYMDGEKLARRFHELYEALAPAFGYETRDETRVFDAESNNGRLMSAVCSLIIEELKGKHEIHVGQIVQRGNCSGCRG